MTRMASGFKFTISAISARSRSGGFPGQRYSISRSMPSFQPNSASVPFEGGHPTFCFGVLYRKTHYYANTPHLIGLLRARRQGPRRSAPQSSNELPPSHS